MWGQNGNDWKVFTGGGTSAAANLGQKLHFEP